MDELEKQKLLQAVAEKLKGSALGQVMSESDNSVVSDSEMPKASNLSEGLDAASQAALKTLAAKLLENKKATVEKPAPATDLATALDAMAKKGMDTEAGKMLSPEPNAKLKELLMRLKGE